MPELPEVETIRRELEPDLLKRRILSVRIARSDIVGWPKPEAFMQELKGARIVEIGRRGKYLIVRVQKAKGSRGRVRSLIIHLRLSGHLEIRSSRSAPQRFERVRFNLSGGKCLIFIEPRVLGRVYLVAENLLPDALGGLRSMGLEPIHPRFDAAYLRGKVGRRTAPIKGLLLDQSIAAGIGNIYSDEALFRAGVRPMRPANRLTRRELERLARTLREVLRDGIRHMGTTMSDARYERPNKMPGGFQKFLMVFDREGEPCRACGAVIKSCRIGNRTTRYCPKCQK